MVGDARRLPSLSSNLGFDYATPASPSLTPDHKFGDGQPAVPAEIDASSRPPLDRRSCSSVCPGSLASACDPRPTAPAPDVVLANHIGCSKLDDAQQCSLPPRCDSNCSSRTCTQPLMHPKTTEATVRPPRAMSLELTASTPSHAARLTGPSSRCCMFVAIIWARQADHVAGRAGCQLQRHSSWRAYSTLSSCCLLYTSPSPRD